MYIDAKETKYYFVVRMKEACGNELATLGTHFTGTLMQI